MKPLAVVTLVLAYAQAVLGGIVRVTGSGMGCGDYWPQCQGEWIPPLERSDLVIEVFHRYTASALMVSTLALLVLVWRSRMRPGIGGSGGVLRAVAAAAALVVAAALLGAATVKLQLDAATVVTHLALAMSLLAALVIVLLRISAVYGIGAVPAEPKTARSATAAAVLAALVVLLGGVTANVAGAAASCVGFPHCRSVSVAGTPLVIQLIHRVLAFLLLFHLLGIVVSMRKRGDGGALKAAAWVALAIVVAQVLVGAAMVESGLPLGARALHQALGTLVWLATFSFAAMARRGLGGAAHRDQAMALAAP